MRVLLVGAGGVGAAAARIAARRDFYDRFVVADYDVDRARRAIAGLAPRGFVAARVDAASAQAVTDLCREHAARVWAGAGVLGPEAFDAVPFLDKLVEYGSPWHLREQ